MSSSRGWPDESPRPDIADILVREGVEIYYEVYENDGPTIMFIPPSPITHSRIFKGQIPFLARHFRVVTLDGRGNGRSGRPVGREMHTRRENVADILAVVETTQTAQAILAAHCHANWWAIDMAASHPEVVAGLVAIDPGVPYLGDRRLTGSRAARHGTWSSTTRPDGSSSTGT